jgi:lipopolysaccharide transport system permease protein
VTKVYFPRLIVPVASALATLFDLLFSIVILIIMMFYFGVTPTTQLIAAPLFVFLALVLAVAFGTLFSALNVRFRDVKFALPFMLQVWMIASPIFYPASLLSEKWRLVFALNPLTGILEGFRSALFGTAVRLAACRRVVRIARCPQRAVAVDLQEDGGQVRRSDLMNVINAKNYRSNTRSARASLTRCARC